MKKKYLKFIGLAVALLISGLIFIFRGRLESLSSLGYFGVFILNLLGSATIFLPIPTFLAAFVLGGILNPLLIALLGGLGSTIGELTGYLAGYSGRAVINKDEKLVKVETWMKKYGLWTIFVLAAIPNPFFDLAGIISGAGRLSIKKFLFATFMGKLIKFLIIAYLGATSVRVLGLSNF